MFCLLYSISRSVTFVVPVLRGQLRSKQQSCTAIRIATQEIPVRFEICGGGASARTAFLRASQCVPAIRGELQAALIGLAIVDLAVQLHQHADRDLRTALKVVPGYPNPVNAIVAVKCDLK